METKYYTVARIDGDCARLRRTDAGEDLLPGARALLPEEIDEGDKPEVRDAPIRNPVTRAELLERLRGGIAEEEWQALEAGELRVSAFNREVLLEMRALAPAPPGAVDEAAVQGLREALVDYLGQYLADAPGAWRWIVIASLYLTFVARRPMHPPGLLHIVQRTERERIVYECPAKSDDPRAACRWCVCRRAAPVSDGT